MVERLPPVPQQLERLAALHRAGELSDEVFAQCCAAIERQLSAAPGPAPAEPRPSRQLQLAVAGFSVALVAAGYAWLGTPQGWSADEPVRAAVHPEAAGHPLDEAQIDAMIERLAARLESEGGDADGWAMLARSQAVRGRHEAAVLAFRRALESRPQDARLLADLAESLAMTRGKGVKAGS